MESMKFMRDDLNLSFSDEQLEDYPLIDPKDVPELVAYAKSRRKALDGPVPERRSPKSNLKMADKTTFSEFDEGTKGKMQVSTTMAFVRLLRSLMKSKELGDRIVPIIPDEARTFGMDPLFSEFGIYHPEGQLYTPVDHKVLMKYKESEAGQLFEEGINEAGATSTFIASATSLFYSFMSDNSILHILFDVWIPKSCRFNLVSKLTKEQEDF